MRPAGDRSAWRWVAVALAALVVASVATTSSLLVAGGADALFTLLESGISLLAAASVGALIVVRRPRNLVGWLLLLIALGFAAMDAGGAYVRSAHASAADLDGGHLLWAAWVGTYGWVLSFPAALLLLPLLYPDGRPPSRRWRPVLWVAATVTCLTPMQALAPGPLDIDGVEVGSNPMGWTALTPVLTVFEAVLLVLFVPLLLACIGALVVRFRRSRGVERQQIKWLVAPFALIPVVIVLTMFPALELIGRGLGGLVLAAAFASIGVAVTRYRLYGIDRVIRRTLSYAVVTVLLAGMYVVGVVGVGGVLRGVGLTGGDLLVAASTLAVAAMFQPVRARVQTAVDRRFNRARYDARQVVERFVRRLRDEVDLDALTREIREATRRSLQPAHVGVWMASGAGERPDPDTAAPHVTVSERRAR